MNRDPERLQKRITNSGYTSRRKVETLITKGKAKANGQVVTELEAKVKPSNTIEVERVKIEQEDRIYTLFYEPTQVIISISDDRGKTVVTGYFKDLETGIYPVGRLDYDTSGLLLLTNGGEFTNLTTHPRYHIQKKYVIKLGEYLMREGVKSLEQEIELKDGFIQPAQVKIKNQSEGKNTTLVEVAISEGRDRQARRTFEHFNCTVNRLIRAELRNLNLKGLNAGEDRVLTPHEVKILKHMAENGN